MFRAPFFPNVVGLMIAIGCHSCLGGQAVHVAKLHQPPEPQQEPCTVDGESRRVAFVHIPKTGTSLGTLIAHYTNTSLPEDASIPDCKKEACPHVDQKSLGQLEFQYRYPTDKWFKDCFWMKDGHGPDGTDWLSHSPIYEDAYQSFKGRFVGFFREPKQRSLSSFYSFERTRLETYGISLEETWARLIEGTAVKLLAGQQFPIEAGATVEEGTVVVPNLKLALSRLDGFMMAGLVEHYELSVCLFHAITGSKWGAHDTENMRQRRARTAEKWDETGLNGYVDPYDTPLYREVKSRFWLKIDEHGLTEKKCHSLCPDIGEEDFL